MAEAIRDLCARHPEMASYASLTNTINRWALELAAERRRTSHDSYLQRRRLVQSENRCATHSPEGVIPC